MYQDTRPDSPYIVTRQETFHEIRRCPLRRAWVLQESYISNRILFLADAQLWWQCCEALCCESWPCGVPVEVIHAVVEPKDIQESHSRWYNLVSDYTYCKLTNFSDKLIAMAGLANHFQASIGDDEYVAGLWRSQLPQALCWRTYTVLMSAFRPSQYRAPSWSWTSLEGGRFYPAYEPDNPTTDLCQILSIHLARAGANPYGDLKGGYISWPTVPNKA
ncbi:hypothetical protein EDB81DRAFT_655599 [Dactylonectria macrodidyma]|uniref:Heterokaryon incompatibility domain-containing protein n=1 Tax=Dactylonectria macrodidyma TaxID=307937 RepID=A0A9P9EPZ7_9HYPO|nr:hypothetical protein EDB81DRAFT_655599 [Dactylonectria macrodidyma]